MDDALIKRYAPGGDIYKSLAAQYGTAGANTIYTAAKTGDRIAVTDAIEQVKYGNPLSTSTAGIFADQIINDPLAAPAESLNNQIGKAFGNLWKNPWVMVAAAAVVFWFLGGGTYLKGILARKAK